MRSVLIVLGAAVAISGSASGQTTSCQTMFGNRPMSWTACNTVAPDPQYAPTPTSSGLAPVYDWHQVAPKRCNAVEGLAYNATNYCDARAVAAAHKTAGDLIASGHCDDALKAALGTGDLEFASQVRDYCASAVAH